MIVQVIASGLGTIGYALMMRMKGKQVVSVGIGGMGTWIVYLIAGMYFDTPFIGALLASMYVGIFAEVMARVHRAPTTIFLTCGAIPLIPGGRFYYFITGVLTKDIEMARLNGHLALSTVFGIAIGFLIITVLNRYLQLAIKALKGK